MASHWDIGVYPAPLIVNFDQLSSALGPEGSSVYITPSNLHLLRDVPGIPSEYQFAQLAGRVVYVTGLPSIITCHNVERIFGVAGRVTVSPALVALQTMHTFRWVVFDEAEGATNAMINLNGKHVAGTEIRVIAALPPNRVVCVEERYNVGEAFEDDDATPRPSQTTFFEALAQSKDDITVTMKERTMSIDSTSTNNKTPRRHVSFGNEKGVLLPSALHKQDEANVPTPKVGSALLDRVLGNISRQRSESNISSITSPSVDSVEDSFITAPLTKSPDSEAHSSTSPAPQLSSSWANIAGRDPPDATLIELQPRKRRSLRLTHRIPSIGSIRSVDVNAEPLAEQKRVILLLNLPNNITLKDISDAVREGSLNKIVFGINEEDKTRYAGIIFHKAAHADDFYYILQRERELSRPHRFRFIVDVCVGEPFPANDEIRAMDYPTYATRRLTMVKAGFFFMFKEDHLRRLCARLVPEENIQLIWLYNGGNATVVFADVGSAMKVKAELERKTAMAGKINGEPEIWTGLVTTFSKDPSLLPLDNLKTTLHD